jgi:GNAT superfamily N-acetyltransferase
MTAPATRNVEPSGVTIRRARPEDSDECHRIMWHSVTDLAIRRGMPMEGTADDWWPSSEPQFQYLARSSAEWWLAEDPGSGSLLGYARSIERGGLFELTEFFVLPSNQARGVGRALLERAFPLGRGEVRSIIATTDVRALARYYVADTVARFPLLTLSGAPSDDRTTGRLEPMPLEEKEAAALGKVAAMERAVLGYDRGEAGLRWLLERREGYLYRRDGRSVGFAFIGRDGSGPMAALDPDDMPELLLHVEARAHAQGVERLSLEVPGLNVVAVRHLMGRGFHIDPWVNVLMSNVPFGQFDRFIGFSPPMFL